jgi:branched-chain amino acid aminotransferase/para-aminobenzoate synthetase component 1
MVEPAPEPFVWLNGRRLPLGRARISPLDRGLLYGDGLFETLRAERGTIFHLQEHLERFRRSAAALRLPPPPDVDWQAVMMSLIEANRLLEAVSRIKIVLTRGESSELGLPRSGRGSCLVTAAPYEPPTTARYTRGWRLHVHREGFAPPLSRYKTLNYLYYLAARQAALDAGQDEAVILDAKGHVAETATGALLIERSGSWWIPESPYRLPSVTLDKVTGLLGKRGITVGRIIVSPANLASADRIWVLNSMMGIMPAAAVDGKDLKCKGGTLDASLRNELFASVPC